MVRHLLDEVGSTTRRPTTKRSRCFLWLMCRFVQRLGALLTFIRVRGILSSLRAILRIIKPQISTYSSLQDLGLTWNATLNTVPFLYVSSWSLLRVSTGEVKSVIMESSEAINRLPLPTDRRYPVDSVWHLPVVARGTLMASANITDMLISTAVYAKNIMVEERIS